MSIVLEVGKMIEYLEKEMKNYPILIKTSEVAKIIGVGRSTVWREINARNLVAVKVRGKLLVLKSDLIDYLLKRRDADGERNVETA